MIIPSLLAGNDVRIYLMSKAYYPTNIISIITFYIMEYSYFNNNKKPLISQNMKIHHQLSNYCYETIFIIKIYAPSIYHNTVWLHICLPNDFLSCSYQNQIQIYYFQAETCKCDLLF
jgi:hypothetical protein